MIKGSHHTDEAKQKNSVAHVGKSHPVSEETRQKISKSHMGIRPSEESRRKNSESNKGNNNRKGSKHKEESKRKMSESKKGNTFRRGKPCSAETIRRMSEAHKGLSYPHPKGKDCPLYKGGRFKNRDGYIILSGQWGHPRHSKGTISEHILVKEKEIGRYLK